MPKISTIDPWPVGTIEESILTVSQFQNQSGDSWVLADGSSATGTQYAAKIAFSLVDLRGGFLRGKNNGRVDSYANPGGDLATGTYQADQMKSHSHTVDASHVHTIPRSVSPGSSTSTVFTGTGFLNTVFSSNVSNASPGFTINSSGGAESRPRSIICNFFVKKDGPLSSDRASMAPIGMMKASLLSETDWQSAMGSGWVLADGSNVSGSLYESIIGSSSVPDMRDMFARGKNNSRSSSTGDASGERSLGSVQDNQNALHDHTTSASGHSHGMDVFDTSGGVIGGQFRAGSGSPNNPDLESSNLNGSISSHGSSEARPKLYIVNFFVRIN